MSLNYYLHLVMCDNVSSCPNCLHPQGSVTRPSWSYENVFHARMEQRKQMHFLEMGFGIM